MKFIFGILRFFWHLLDGVRKMLHLFLLLLLVGVVLLASATRVPPAVPSTAALVIAPEGALVEQLSSGPFERAIAEVSNEQQTEVLLRSVIEAIKLAKNDPHIKVLFLQTDELVGGGIAKLEEVAIALRDFRASGKPVIAFGHSYTQAQYYLAAQADQVYLDPEGWVFIDGFGYYRMYLKDALDKLAININIFKAGKYKSYTDQFSRTEMSAEEREEAAVWLQSVWSTYQVAVTQARGLEQAALNEYVAQLVPSLSQDAGMAKLALDHRLITDIKTQSEVEAQLAGLTGMDSSTHRFRAVDYQDYLTAVHATRPVETSQHNKVGVVVAAGTIVDGPRSAGVVAGDAMVDLLQQARFDHDVKAVVLRIDSPGGSVFASELIYREVAALKKAGKPVIASMSSTAASGGYYIAMNADEIWANAATITGSIGVFAVVPTFEHTLEKLGIKTDGLGTTPLSGALRTDRGLTADAQAILQYSVDHIYGQFVRKVAEGREKPVDEIEALAQGRVWAGTDARQKGLVDQLGSIDDAVQAAAARAGLGADYAVDYIEEKYSWRQLFAQEVSAFSAKIIQTIAPQQSVVEHLQHLVSPLEAELARLSVLKDPGQVFYYCMCTYD